MILDGKMVGWYNDIQVGGSTGARWCLVEHRAGRKVVRARWLPHVLWSTGAMVGRVSLGGVKAGTAAPSTLAGLNSAARADLFDERHGERGGLGGDGRQAGGKNNGRLLLRPVA